MEENTNVFLGTERVGKLMRGYAVPCIISLLVGALYNIVSSDRGGARNRGNGRRRLLRVCEYQPR